MKFLKKKNPPKFPINRHRHYYFREKLTCYIKIIIFINITPYGSVNTILSSKPVVVTEVNYFSINNFVFTTNSVCNILITKTNFIRELNTSKR